MSPSLKAQTEIVLTTEAAVYWLFEIQLGPAPFPEAE